LDNKVVRVEKCATGGGESDAVFEVVSWLPDEWQQAAGESRRQAASQAEEIKTQAKAGALIEEPSQKRASRRKLERQRSWQGQGMRQKARARKSATGDPEVQWTADGGYSSAA